MNDLMPVYTACVLVLCLKMFAISCYQGFFRIRGRAFTYLFYGMAALADAGSGSGF